MGDDYVHDEARSELESFCTLLSEHERSFARISLELEGERCFQLPDGEEVQRPASPGPGLPLAHVLRDYRLSVKEKIRLSHAISQAFWQFYDSELMLAKWTSNDIWFMPEDTDDGGELLPCMAYISFHIEQTDYELEECSSARSLIHRCPRILALAILLLEIGLGKAFQPKTCQPFVAQMNIEYRMASRLLCQLQTTPWENFAHKDIYIDAVQNCLKNVDFVAARKGCEPERRSMLYEHVVSPLAWLAESFKRIDNEVTYISRRHETKGTHEESTMTPALEELEEQLHLASFHGGRPVNPQAWLDDLRVINGYVRQIRDDLKDIRPIRVAILDTGCHPTAPYFEGTDKASHVKMWKDFVTDSETPVDSYGHGTFMTALVIEAAPLTEICVVRVAENSTQLRNSQENVAKVSCYFLISSCKC
jgi:hypothetical protein